MPEHRRGIYAGLCRQLLQRHADSLPDLRRVQVILPSHACCTRFRLDLLDQLPDGSHAVIPPACDTLHGWVDNLVPVRSGVRILSQAQRQLQFVEALQQNPGLFREDNKWQVATALLQLFDDLWLHAAGLPDDAAQWHEVLRTAYQAAAVTRHLSQEAALVHTLWVAWQQQLDANAQSDPVRHYAWQLGQAAARVDAEHIYVTATGLSPVEQALVDELSASGHCCIIDPYQHAPAQADNRELIDNCFATDDGLLQRSHDYAGGSADLLLYRAGSIEQQVSAIRLQLLNWLARDRHEIAVICEDRKLSRRLRAVLEQDGVLLEDDAGWFLSTTSAAAVIVRWLECIESGFEQHAFLDLLKSRFVFPAQSDDKLEAVFRFERDIVRRQNVATDLGRYRYELEQRRQRLLDIFHWPPASYQRIAALLDTMETISSGLRELHQDADRHPISHYLDALLDSLVQLQAVDALLADAAGAQVIDKIRTLLDESALCDPRMSWSDFRYFLQSQLEQELFRPQAQGSAVRLMTLEQSEQLQFDAIIIAAAEEDFFPGSMPRSPFFNQSVRASLGLSDLGQYRETRLRAFKHRLYDDVPCLITCLKEQDGDPVSPSPWVEALRQFTLLATGYSIEAANMEDILERQLVDERERAATPAQRAPVTGVAADDVPLRLSTSSHQRLIDCPYRFLAADIMGLKTAEEIITELKKSDYGERVHEALQAFHTPRPGLPQAFTEIITADNRDAAISRLEQISEHVFRRDMDRNALHRSWLTRWKRHIPAYIAWQMRQQQGWRVETTELKTEAAIDDTHSLGGRLDRVDRSHDGDGHAIIDYKTGKAARLDDVLCGENVQLTSYALLKPGTTRVSYLELDKDRDKVAEPSVLAGEELEAVSNGARQRLVSLVARTAGGEPLPAWGDEKTCSWCEFEGICRRSYWIGTRQ